MARAGCRCGIDLQLLSETTNHVQHDGKDIITAADGLMTTTKILKNKLKNGTTKNFELRQRSSDDLRVKKFKLLLTKQLPKIRATDFKIFAKKNP